MAHWFGSLTSKDLQVYNLGVSRCFEGQISSTLEISCHVHDLVLTCFNSMMLINDSQHDTRSYPSQSAHVWAQGWSSKVANRTPPRRRIRRRSQCRTAASRSRTTRSLLRAVPRWRQKPTNGRPTMPQPQHTVDVDMGHWWSLMVTVGGEKQVASLANALRSLVWQMCSGSVAQWTYAIGNVPFLELRMFSCSASYVLLCFAATCCYMMLGATWWSAVQALVAGPRPLWVT